MWKLVAVVVGLVVLWAIYSFCYLSGPPCPSVAEIAAKSQQHPATKQCARLREVAQNIKGIAFVNDALLRVVPAPFCEILDLLEPFQKHAETQNFDLKVRLVNKEAQKLPVYIQGENIIIEITTPAKFDSFVYVDYYATDGQVQHLFPNLQEALNFFPPRSVSSVGQRDNQHLEWKPFPPFGRELLSVIVSKQPLVFTFPSPKWRGKGLVAR